MECGSGVRAPALFSGLGHVRFYDIKSDIVPPSRSFEAGKTETRLEGAGSLGGLVLEPMSARG